MTITLVLRGAAAVSVVRATDYVMVPWKCTATNLARYRSTCTRHYKALFGRGLLSATV